ncbi:E3 ubiquitin-protein ligase MIB2 isoform X2 [Octopus bimaculoides]|uniref:RING-type domain-containing protein n=1 Tax=Octopus bimaculoides TaxID=37653 RepID=A0A0L8GZF6_OCTBM|nr:E3 ubiquitin-protein ligase MIB2 isoform X2 [Octopus bimaculoides]|eukprot:XP_014776763.1 PREDICTED: E3 ubiquitin-protein ligase MIB2-like isoform X2 [Octopus bimaculoides]
MFLWRSISSWYFQGKIQIHDVIGKIKNSDINYMKKFIEDHPDKVNQIDADGKTCLMAACYQFNTHLTNLLIDAGAELNMRDKDSKTALHHAVLVCNLPAVMILISRGSDVNGKDRDDLTPLHLAALKGKEWKEVVAALLQAKGQSVNVNQRDIIGQTPLHYACSRGDTKTVHLLLNHTDISVNMVDNYGATPLDIAVREQHYDVVTLMLSQVSVKMEMNYMKMTPFLLAVSRGHLGMIHKLIARGAEVNARNNEGNNCLHLAVKKEVFHSEEEPLIILNECCTELKLRNENRLSGVVVASYLALQGADFYCKNKNGIAPLDLIKNAKLNIKVMTLFPPQCRWCQEKKASVTLHPCQHILVCENCCSEMTFKRCPMCRQSVLRKSGFESPMFEEKEVQTVSDAVMRPKSVTKQVQTVASTSEKASKMKEKGVQTVAEAAETLMMEDKQVWTVTEAVESRKLEEKDLLRVAKRLGSDWWQVGVFLGIEITELEIDDGSNNTVKQGYNMLYEWFTSCDPQTRILETLSAALEEAECLTALECLSLVAE